MTYAVAMERSGLLLRVRVSGQARDFESAVTAWRAIADEARRERSTALLVASELQGVPYARHELERLVQSVRGLGLEALRIAFVYSQVEGWADVEAAEILAVEAGFHGRAFNSAHEAELWLRHGER